MKNKKMRSLKDNLIFKMIIIEYCSRKENSDVLEMTAALVGVMLKETGTSSSLWKEEWTTNKIMLLSLSPKTTRW